MTKSSEHGFLFRDIRDVRPVFHDHAHQYPFSSQPGKPSISKGPQWAASVGMKHKGLPRSLGSLGSRQW